MRILLADDDMVSRTLVERHLESWGFDTEVVFSGDAALRALQKDSSIRMAILDWIMPGTSGLDVCRSIKESGLSHLVWVIMLTSRTRSRDLAEAFDRGADDYISKPFAAAELKARVEAGMRTLTLESKLQGKIAELQAALTHVKLLQGILPICAWCKKVRDDDDYWREVEEYVAAHTDARFSHGICPDCLKTRFAEYDIEGK